MAYVVNGTHFCALRACGAREAGFFPRINFVCQDVSNKVLHAHGWVQEVSISMVSQQQQSHEILEVTPKVPFRINARELKISKILISINYSN